MRIRGCHDENEESRHSPDKGVILFDSGDGREVNELMGEVAVKEKRIREMKRTEKINL